MLLDFSDGPGNVGEACDYKGTVPSPATSDTIENSKAPSIGRRVSLLDIEEIEPFKNGPRLARNPKWSAIKAAIRASGGLTNMLAVTRRPSERRYVCHQGGNTRLLILKELFRETGDPRFRWVQAEILPYKNEFDLTLLHDRENSCRGDLTFIEAAWSKYRLYELFCATTTGKKTGREFVKHLRTEHGVDITAEDFSRIKYAIEVLYQHMPTCLIKGGMTLRAVRKVISTRNCLKKAWRGRLIGSVEHFDETFYGLLARQNREFEELLGLVDADDDSMPGQQMALDWQRFLGDFAYEVSIYAEVNLQKAVSWVEGAVRHLDFASDHPGPTARPSAQSASPALVNPPPTLKDRRAAAYDAARKLASSVGMEELIEPVDGAYGYKLSGSQPASGPDVTRSCWWALALATEPWMVVREMMEQSSDVPSFADLPPTMLRMLAELFASHALIASQERS